MQWRSSLASSKAIISPDNGQGKTDRLWHIAITPDISIAGIFDVGMYEYDPSFVFMPLGLASDFFGYDGRVSALEIYAATPEQIGPLRRLVSQSLASNLSAFDWIERNRGFLNALRVERNVMFLILTLIILVAAFNIISSMIMLVRSKNADIAVLRTMGASSGSIMRVFLMTGASIGIVGPRWAQCWVWCFAGILMQSNYLLKQCLGLNYSRQKFISYLLYRRRLIRRIYLW